MSKALAFRLRKVLPNIIHHNQSGCVEGRYIGETISTIYDIVDFTKSESTSGIVSVPFVEWNFIHRCMKVFVSDLTLKDDFQYFTKLVSTVAFAIMVYSQIILFSKDPVFGKEGTATVPPTQTELQSGTATVFAVPEEVIKDINKIVL